MRNRLHPAGLAMAAVLACAPMVKGASLPDARIIVTVSGDFGRNAATLKKEDIHAGSLRITGAVPLTGNDEVYIVIDDGASQDFGDRITELRDFVMSRPSTSAIGVAFIHNGGLNVALKPTTDHSAAARALRPPAGSDQGSPYCAVSSLIAEWPLTVEHRVIVLITTGIDYSSPIGGVCSSAETVIADAQRNNIVLYTIHHPPVDYDSDAWRRVASGLTEISHVSYDTGGEAYFVGHGPAESIAPFLANISQHMLHQYLVTIDVNSAMGQGFQDLYLTGDPSGPDLMVPTRVWIPDKSRSTKAPASR